MMITDKKKPRPLRVLVVDDYQRIADTLATLLCQDGYEAQAAYTAQDCLRIAQAESPDVILLDLRLPDVDGWQVARTLRGNEKTKNVKVIALTANCQPEDLKRSEEAGIDHHIAKPIRLADLVKLFPSAVD